MYPQGPEYSDLDSMYRDRLADPRIFLERGIEYSRHVIEDLRNFGITTELGPQRAAAGLFAFFSPRHEGQLQCQPWIVDPGVETEERLSYKGEHRLPSAEIGSFHRIFGLFPEHPRSPYLTKNILYSKVIALNGLFIAISDIRAQDDKRGLQAKEIEALRLRSMGDLLADHMIIAKLPGERHAIIRDGRLRLCHDVKYSVPENMAFHYQLNEAGLSTASER